MLSDGKVFVIGLDGATLHLVKKWASEGRLPNLARLMAEGTFGHSQTVPNQNSAPAWSSFMTGKNPGKHGIYHFYEKEENGYNIRYLNGGDNQSEPIWGILSRSGKKVGVLSVPMTYPAREVNGIFVSGWDAPSKDSKRFTFPEALVDELYEAIPDYVILSGLPSLVENNQHEQAIKVALDSIGARSRAAQYFMDKYPWDFFMVVFVESDVIQHYFWRYMEEGGKYSDTILNFYVALDREVGVLLSKLPDDCHVVVLSDHGLALSEGGPPYLNFILKHLGMLKFRDHEAGHKVRLMRKAFSFFRRHTSRKTKEFLLRHLPRLRDKVDSQRCFSNIDWSGTKAFGEPTRMELWINLKGREPQGVISPGEEYDSVCEEIRKTLYRWHDPATGKKVVKSVFKKEEVYQGKHMEKAPDLLIIFEDDVWVSGVMLLDEDGKKEYVDFPADIADILTVNGVHRDTGIFMIKGPGVRKGREITGARIIDLAPTILYLMGQRVPSDMDGRVLTDAFDENMIKNKPLIMDDSSTDSAGQAQEREDYSEDENKTIEERLRGLGYIE